MAHNTKWIWKNGENDENTWMNFVKKLNLDCDPENAAAKIAVDSKYWLWTVPTESVYNGGAM